jgi:hypothetical protein
MIARYVDDPPPPNFANVESAVAAERERCAKLAEQIAGGDDNNDVEIYIARKIADAIRKLG